jgi:outer membrane protein assembly factor BamD (BamD/ComL family)
MMKHILILFLAASLIAGCKSEKRKQAELIQGNEKILFNDSSKMLNKQLALSQVTLYKEFAEKYPEDSLAPLYLFRAADLAHGMRQDREAMDLYRQFLAKYPSHQKAAASLFLVAFVYDNDFHQTDSAKIKYREFLQKYPEHSLAPSAKAALDQLEMGLTDEQLIKMFEARQDSLQKTSN